LTKGADKRGYVWVFASPEAAVYAPTREGDTVRETLAGFKGVLVSDFYAAYDAMDCQQQKCLVHLVRDFFWWFLLSGETDIESFTAGQR
jgi:hypothetical protein